MLEITFTFIAVTHKLFFSRYSYSGHYHLHRCLFLVLVLARPSSASSRPPRCQCLDGRRLLSGRPGYRHPVVHGPRLSRHCTPGRFIDPSDLGALPDAQPQEDPHCQQDSFEINAAYFYHFRINVSVGG